FDDDSPFRRLRPAEGWTMVIAVVALPFAVAWSLDNAQWLIGASGSTGYLLYLAVASALLGIGLAKLDLGRFRAYLVGAVVGGLGSLVGAVVGAVLIEFLPFWSQGLSKQAPSVIYGAVIVALMLILPGGLGGLSATVSRLWSRISPSFSRQS
ncbi:MAG TPA: hypothetical protein VIU86_14725, partial [Gaiellaceae bacterium]